MKEVEEEGRAKGMGGEKAAEEQAGRPREGRGQQMVQVE